LCERYRFRFYGLTGKEKFITNPKPCVIGWISDYPDVVERAQRKS